MCEAVGLIPSIEKEKWEGREGGREEGREEGVSAGKDVEKWEASYIAGRNTYNSDNFAK
jgi:hypothetical protein